MTILGTLASRCLLHTGRACRKQSSSPAFITKATKMKDKDQRFAFVDCMRVKVKGGDGGNGGISLLSLYANEFAGPDGGNGGNGGHVIFRACTQEKSLSHLDKIEEAQPGKSGGRYDLDGKNAAHKIIDVPVGTIFRNSHREIVAELTKEGSMFIAAKGGAGGKGNAFFKSSDRQRPMCAEIGGKGESFTFEIELRTIADVGLIGFPNAGKSTLLRAISRARPKVASYAFTTIKPHIGMVPYEDGVQLAVADIPGIIPDAHKNRGLGVTFLRHVERCSCLLFVIDLSLTNPHEQFECLDYELSQYSPELAKRPRAIIANKIDLEEARSNLAAFSDWHKRRGFYHLIPVSAKCGIHIEDLLRFIRRMYDEQMSFSRSPFEVKT